VQIPKPDGSKRQLGIPTVLDRVIQQAILQILELIYEPKFSNSSYGFRPNRSAEMALRQACEYLRDGYKYVVDMDLEKFFDRVNHDILMERLSRDISDELDKELEKRGHKFCRYADDCNIYVKSQEAGNRVLKSITEFLATRLKLKVNETKSAVAHVTKRKFLGYMLQAKTT
jgi:retron-type reverse transcriptase